MRRRMRTCTIARCLVTGHCPDSVSSAVLPQVSLADQAVHLAVTTELIGTLAPLSFSMDSHTLLVPWDADEESCLDLVPCPSGRLAERTRSVTWRHVRPAHRHCPATPAGGVHGMMMPPRTQVVAPLARSHALRHACCPGQPVDPGPGSVCRVPWPETSVPWLQAMATRRGESFVSLASSVVLTQEAALGMYSFQGEHLGSVQLPAVEGRVAATLAADSQGRRLAVLQGATLLVYATDGWKLLASFSIPEGLSRASAVVVRHAGTTLQGCQRAFRPWSSTAVISIDDSGEVAGQVLQLTGPPSVSRDGRWLAYAQSGSALVLDLRSGAQVFQHAIARTEGVHLEVQCGWTPELALLVTASDTSASAPRAADQVTVVNF